MMKFTGKVALSFLASLFAPFLVAAETSRRVGLEDAKRYAIEHNFEVASLRRALEEAKSKSSRTRSPFYPRIGVVGGADGQVSTNFTNTGPVAFVYGSYNLFSGFEDTYKLQVADIEEEKAEIRLKRAAFRVGLDVEKAFHNYVFKTGIIGLKQEALKLNETHKRMAKNRRASGLSSDSDVMEFDLRESILRSDLLLLEQELEDARSTLRRLLGEEIGSSIEPTGKLQHQHLKSSLVECMNRIKSENETVQLAARDVSAATIESNLWRSKWLPRIDIEARVGYLPYDLRPTSNTASYAGFIYAKFDLFSGFDVLWERREEQARKMKVEAQLKDAILSSITQTEIAYRRIKTIQSRVDLEAENHVRATRYYKSVLSEYGRGVKNSADVRMAAETQYEAVLREQGYKYEFLSDRIDLERSLGGPVETVAISDESGAHEGH